MVTKASLAAPYYASAIRSLTACSVPISSVDALEALEGFSAGIRRILKQLVQEAGGEEAIAKSLARAKTTQGRRNLLESLNSINEAPEHHIAANSAVLQPPQKSIKRMDGNVRQAKNAKSSAQFARKSPTARVMKDKDREAPVSLRSPPKAQEAAKRRPNKQYVPHEGSGGYAILLALFLLSRSRNGADEQSQEASFTKDEVITFASKYCRYSFTHQFASRSTGGGGKVPKYATAWARMKTLLSKGLVWQRGRPARFSLSPDGQLVGRQIARAAGQDIPEPESDDETRSNFDSGHQTGQRQTASHSLREARSSDRDSEATNFEHENDSEKLKKDIHPNDDDDSSLFASLPSSPEPEPEALPVRERQKLIPPSQLILPPKENVCLRGAPRSTDHGYSNETGTVRASVALSPPSIWLPTKHPAEHHFPQSPPAFPPHKRLRLPDKSSRDIVIIE